MTEHLLTKSFSDELSRRVLEAWQVGHGGNPDEVHILLGDSSIALTIPRAMVQAEKVLFNNTTNTRILDQYIRSVLEMIAEDLKPLIEDYTSREIQQVIPLIDLKAGWITAFYKFKDKVDNKDD